jgi:hypothetical protein
MKRMRDPRRLTDAGSSALPELAAAIRELRAQRCTPGQVAALTRALAERTGPPDAPSRNGSLGAAVKYSLGGLVLVLGVGAAWQLQHSGPGIAARRTDPVAPAPEPKAIAASVRSAVAPSGASPPELAERAAVQSATARRVARKDPRPAATAAPEQELALLRRSHAALETDAGAALALAQEHERLYANGMFAQERELLAIEALLRLGKTPAALDRAQRFIERYPESPHSLRVRAVLERERP